MLDELPDGRLGGSMAREQLLRRLTAMATDVVARGNVELALGWFLSEKNGDPLPRVPPDLFDTLTFVHDHGGQEVDAGYKGWDYFEDCLLLALRKSQTGAKREPRVPAVADAAARLHPVQPAVQGT